MAVLDIAQRALEPLPIPGKARFSERLLRLAKPKSLTCHPVAGVEVRLRPSQRIERLMWAGAYEPKLVAFFKSNVKPGMTLVDAGANIGYFAAIAAHLTGSAGAVHAFEPNPDCYARLADNLLPFPQARAYQMALSDHEGKSALYLDQIQGEDGWGSLFEHPGAVRVPDVSLTTLDQFARGAGIRRVDLIKIDTEGSELRVLRGARELIQRDHPKIVVELNAPCLARDHVSADDVGQFLTERGYSLHPSDGNLYAA